MDIEYLLLLQHFREGGGAALAPFMRWASDFAISFWPIAMISLIYWCVDRKYGKRILFGFYSGVLINGFLKLTFCVYRPWIRDARIIPYGQSILSSTGYSFPSGHSSWACTIFGGTALWMKQRGWKIPALLFFLFVLVVMFSRNYLGVHTPQDVVVGFLSGLLAIYAANRVEDWTDADPKRDLIVMGAGLLFCAVLMAYYEMKSYPIDYLANGKLMVDPVRMKADSYQGLGCVAGYLIARYFERRSFDFEAEVSRKIRLIIGVLALLPAYGWLIFAMTVVKHTCGRPFGEFIMFFVYSFYLMSLVPWVMGVVAKKGHGSRGKVSS